MGDLIPSTILLIVIVAACFGTRTGRRFIAYLLRTGSRSHDDEDGWRTPWQRRRW